ncbi:MAG: glucose-6-phosphate isomerase family protein [Bacillota bacterium]|jgi:glucose-6-phosphate isomerase
MIEEAKFMQEWGSIPKGEGVISKQTHFADIQSIYERVDGLSKDTLMYTVYSTTSGSLLWGQTILEPVLVHGECNMTRGHFHQRRDLDEYYWCQKGEGLLMLMDAQGKCWCEKMKPGSLHHIYGQWAHRCINTGKEALSVIACWPADAGHDYDLTFPIRVFKENDQILLKK